METTRKNESGNHISPNGNAVWATLFGLKVANLLIFNGTSGSRDF